MENNLRAGVKKFKRLLAAKKKAVKKAAMKKIAEVYRQMKEKRGPHYDRWVSGMAAAKRRRGGDSS